MAGSILRCSLVVVDALKSPGRRVSDRLVCTTSRWPISLEANCDVPPCSLAEQRRMKVFPHRPLPSYAASFSLGLSPARDAKRTSMSRLNCPILPRLISDTRDCVMPSALAA